MPICLLAYNELIFSLMLGLFMFLPHDEDS
jgi:hypothetical protein